MKTEHERSHADVESKTYHMKIDAFEHSLYISKMVSAIALREEKIIAKGATSKAGPKSMELAPSIYVLYPSDVEMSGV